MYLKKKELLEWIEREQNNLDWSPPLRLGFLQTKKKIQSGAFDAQVFSTTNLYICPKCEVISDQNSWNMATRNIFGDDIGEIQTDEGDIFVCPSCKGKSDRTEINPIQSNNAGMEKGAEG